MKKLMMLLISSSAFAGQVSYQNMYSNYTFVQGTGKTSFEAQADAEKAIPEGYLRDSGNSSAIQCTDHGAPQEKLGWGCEDSDTGNLVRMTIPLVKQTTK